MSPRPALANSTFLAACRGEAVSRTPVWFMRQAGRSLPEYREIRARHSFNEMVTKPDVAAEVTLQPIRRHGVDAAVLFSDLITPVQSIVAGISVETGKGPVIDQPFRTASDIARLRPLEPDLDLPYVAEAIRICVEELDPLGVPVVGFAGAPFTVATYLIEGGKSKEFEATKELMYSHESVWHDLMDRLAGISLAALRAQIIAGASAIQLFDSWAGILSAADYRRYALPYSAKVFAGLADLGVPRVHFGVGTGELLGAMADAGPDVVGVDWRVSLTDARTRVPAHIGLQGNLDPVVLLAGWDVTKPRAEEVLATGRATGPRYVFNLGHGVLPSTDPTVLTRLVELVHNA
jgi:uroporphyrinogen decarboxylase